MWARKSNVGRVMLTAKSFTAQRSLRHSWSWRLGERSLPAILMRKVASSCLQHGQFHKDKGRVLHRDDYWC